MWRSGLFRVATCESGTKRRCAEVAYTVFGALCCYRENLGPIAHTGERLVTTESASDQRPAKETQSPDAVSIRFCGDSGDGMQITGGQFANTTAVFGNDFATFPDFPAEIRAPKGTTFGVSGFQVQFSREEIYTPGDKVNALVAMNPAGFRMNIGDVVSGGLIIVNEDEFDKGNLAKCGYEPGYNPLDDPSILRQFKLLKVPMSRLTRESLVDSGMGAKDIDRCRNMFALGIVYWIFERPMDTTIKWFHDYFGQKKNQPEVARANEEALKAGYYFGETTELITVRYSIAPAKHPAGLYRQISGNGATALGMVAATVLTGKQLTYASYPITPATEIMHRLAHVKHFGVKTFQAEDELAAVCAAIGASFAGDLAATGTSGPGLALKSEAIGLAVMMELPLVVINVQRAGPATGMPTKTEQADLFQALWGRPGESPCIVIAPRSPADCFQIVIEAFRMAIRHMCPVIVLSDAYISNGAEPWLIPDIDNIAPIVCEHATEPNADGEFHPYLRNSETLARPWAIPGTAGLEHRIGGLEKTEDTGDVSYDPENHDRMVRSRAEKIARASDAIPSLEVRGPKDGDVLLLGWGGTYGAITTAADSLREMGHRVSSAHLRHLNPFPKNLGEILGQFRKIIIPEINLGQLRVLIRDRFLIDAAGINQMEGRMFSVEDLIEETLRIMPDSGIPVEHQPQTAGKPR
ncbi:MAG: 2-oxoacid:acceptor oxidoreductase subunit alpha [Phycisphaerales bacterium]|nr:MAG: 2-oxoacid:acceptor oxidoreductase subunit alpha [Phycisphaerales bacterium]